MVMVQVSTEPAEVPWDGRWPFRGGAPRAIILRVNPGDYWYRGRHYDPNVRRRVQIVEQKLCRVLRRLVVGSLGGFLASQERALDVHHLCFSANPPPAHTVAYEDDLDAVDGETIVYTPQ
jgi:hypothetical protein